MKVTGVDTFKAWIDWCNWLFVRVTTDEGLHGWGEASLHGPLEAVEAAIHEVSAAVVGRDPAGVERHWQAMYHAWRWRGGSVQMSALSALDIALWDLEGKRLGVPVCRLLGGPLRDRVRVYASHWLSGVETPEEAHSGAKEAVRRGFSAFKWNPFRTGLLKANEHRALVHAAALMAAAREGAGPEVDIFLECSERLSPRTAVMAAEALAPYRPGWLEEPIPFENAAAMIRLQREIAVPIATGERLLSRWEYRELLEGGGCRIVQPDVMHAGGLTEVRKIAAMADTYYVPVAPHNPGGPIATAASLHLAAAIPNLYILEQMEGERALRDRVATVPLRYADGFVEVPATPGLGTDLDLDALRAHAYRRQPVSKATGPTWV